MKLAAENIQQLTGDGSHQQHLSRCRLDLGFNEEISDGVEKAACAGLQKNWWRIKWGLEEEALQKKAATAQEQSDFVNKGTDAEHTQKQYLLMR